MAKRRFQINSISLVGPRERVVLVDRDAAAAARETERQRAAAEIDEIMRITWETALHSRQRKAASAPRRRKRTDAEIAATFNAELRKRGGRVKTAAISATAEALGMSAPQIKRRLKTILDH